MRMMVGAVGVLAAVMSAGTFVGVSGGVAASRVAESSDPGVPGEVSVVGLPKEACMLTGHGETYTADKFGIEAGDRGYPFEYQRRVWWLFGDSRPVESSAWPGNATSRYPGDPQGFDNDSIASSKPTKSGHCPVLHFVQETTPVPGAYANPSIIPDPWPGLGGAPVSLRTNESAVAGIGVGGHIYVVFDTDDPRDAGLKSNCNGCKFGNTTRSVMGEQNSSDPAEFDGLYDLSAPATRYGDGAKFVSVAIEAGNDGYIYIWGTQGGSGTGDGPPYLARILPANIASGAGIEYYNGLSDGSPVFEAGEQNATGLFQDEPACIHQLGVQWNSYINQWVMLYNCNNPIPGYPYGGIYLRTAYEPWGPWTAPVVIYNPAPDAPGHLGLCYLIHVTEKSKCPKGAPNPEDKKGAPRGGFYGPYFIPGWTTGTRATYEQRATSTFYYTLDTFSPYGQVILENTVEGPPPPPKPTVPHCKGSTCS